MPTKLGLNGYGYCMDSPNSKLSQSLMPSKNSELVIVAKQTTHLEMRGVAFMRDTSILECSTIDQLYAGKLNVLKYVVKDLPSVN